MYIIYMYRLLDGSRGEEIYYIGVIDILQQYNLRKRAETIIKVNGIFIKIWTFICICAFIYVLYKIMYIYIYICICEFVYRYIIIHIYIHSNNFLSLCELERTTFQTTKYIHVYEFIF
jgi:hypothetical protein